MSYQRVLPRDAFNEANFLKCIGALTMAIEDKQCNLTYWYDGNPFELHQDESGNLFIGNMGFALGDTILTVFRPLNSRDPWPLYAMIGDEERLVFDNEGNYILEQGS